MKKLKYFLFLLCIIAAFIANSHDVYAADKTTGSAIEYFEVTVKSNAIGVGDTAQLNIKIPTPGDGVVRANVKLQWCSNIDNPGTKTMKDIPGETDSSLSVKLDKEGRYAFTCKYAAEFLDFEGLKLYSGETTYEWIVVGNPPNTSDRGNNSTDKNGSPASYVKYNKDELNTISINNPEWTNKNFIVMARKDGIKNRIAPLTIFSNGKINFISPENGDYAPVYNEKTYTDITEHWAKDSIDFVSAREIFQGVSEKEFSPNSTMTKGMFVTVLSRLNNEIATNNYSEGYYYDAVIWACNNRIATTDIRLFYPEKNITREEMAIMLYNYSKHMKLKIEDESIEISFNDYDSIYYKDAVIQLSKWGIFRGDENNNFNPGKTTTRAEVAAVVQRFVEVMLK